MKAYIKWLTLGFLLTSCASTRYANEFGETTLIHTDQYEVIQSKVTWTHAYPEGCPVVDFFEQFPEYDEIINVSISEQVYEKKFSIFMLQKESTCKFTGIGIRYKSNLQKDSILTQSKADSLKSNIQQQESSSPTSIIPQAENSPLDTAKAEQDSSIQVSTQSPTELTAEEKEKRIQEQRRIQNARIKYRDAMLKKKQNINDPETLSTPVSNSEIKRND